MGCTKKRSLLTEAIGIESQLNKFREIEPFKTAGEELIEYLPYFLPPQNGFWVWAILSINKNWRSARDGKNKCQIKRNNSSTHVSLAASAILFWKLCWLFQISSGRDGRASGSGRHTIEHTGIVLPILAAIPVVQTNRLWHNGMTEECLLNGLYPLI